MSISQVGKADVRLAELGRDHGSADFETAVKTSRVGLSLTARTQAQGPDAKLDGLLEQLLTVLQPQRGERKGPSNDVPGGDDQKLAPVERGHGPVVHGGPGPVIPQQPDGGQNDTAHLLQQVIALLNKQLESGQLDPKEADQIAKLLPMLEQKFVSIADPQQQGGPQTETELLSQLTKLLGGGDQQGAPDGSVYGEKRGVAPEQQTYDPSGGISGDEIDAMIAHANGQGPEVNFASYDRPPTNQA